MTFALRGRIDKVDIGELRRGKSAQETAIAQQGRCFREQNFLGAEPTLIRRRGMSLSATACTVLLPINARHLHRNITFDFRRQYITACSALPTEILLRHKCKVISTTMVNTFLVVCTTSAAFPDTGSPIQVVITKSQSSSRYLHDTRYIPCPNSMPVTACCTINGLAVRTRVTSIHRRLYKPM